jgi:transcriptional regulator with XRE-family HTH domain
MEKMSEAIRELRNKIGESQQVFATNLGISIRALTNYESRDDARTPPLEVLLNLATLATNAGHPDLARPFVHEFRQHLASTLIDQRIAFHMEEPPKGKPGPLEGLLMLSARDHDEFLYTGAFFEAYTDFSSDDEGRRKRGKRILDALKDAWSAEQQARSGLKRKTK